MLVLILRLALFRAGRGGTGGGGVDVENEGVTDCMASFVWEPALVKINALSSATEAACVILSVDETIRARASDQGGPGPALPQGAAQRAVRQRGRGGMPRR